MAKKDKSPSMADFFEEDLTYSSPETEEGEEVEDEEEQEEEEDEEKEDKSKKKETSKKKEKKSSKKKEEEQEEEAEEESEEETSKEKDKSKEKEQETEKEEEDNSAPDPKAFFEEVDKITGLPVEVDFGEVDPLTPQGIALRDKAVREAALDDFLGEIEQNYPAAFKALQYAHNGGDITDLFKEISTRDYTKVEIKDEDDALATEILKDYYKSRGIKSESRINKMIEIATDSEEGIIAESRAALKELQEEQTKKEEELLESQKQAAAEEKKRDQVLGAAIEEVLETGTLSTFKINPKETSDFRKFVVGSIRRVGNGSYNFVTTVEPKNLEQQLQYLYFQFKKGDLQNLIQIKQTTEKTQRLKLKLKAEEAKNKKSTVKEENNTFASMKDFEE